MVSISTLNSITTPRLNKVDQIPVMPFQTLSGNRNSVSSTIDVTNFSSVSVGCMLGRISSANFTPGGVNFRIEMAPMTGMWHPITIFTSALGSGIVSTTLSANSAAGATQITVTAGVFAVGNIIYLEDATIANSEFARVIAVAGTTLVVETPLINAHAATTTLVTNQAEIYYALIDTTSFKSMRTVVDGSNAGQNFDAVCNMTVGA